MKSLTLIASVLASSMAFAGEVNERSYVGHISCALENSKDHTLSMTFSPLRTNGSYVRAEAMAELKGYTCWGEGFYNDSADVAGMLETKASFPSGQKISQSVLNSYASRMTLDDNITCSCLVQIAKDGHPRMAEYCRSSAEASALQIAGSGSTVKGSKILSSKISGSQGIHVESYEVTTQQTSGKRSFRVVVSAKPFVSCDVESVVETKK